jgi:multiple sugar transport system permease protein
VLGVLAVLLSSSMVGFALSRLHFPGSRFVFLAVLGTMMLPSAVTLMLPLVRPALLSVTVFEFQAKWNDFMTPLIYIQNPNLRTLPLGLQIFVQHLGYGQFHWELLFAASVLVTLPMVILFLVAQRQFIDGIQTTGMKG